MALLSLSLAASSASYATATLTDSRGQLRKVNVQPLAQSGVRIAMLASEAAPEVTRAIAQTWFNIGLRAELVLPSAGGAALALESLFKALADGVAVGAAVDAAKCDAALRAQAGVVW